MPTYITTAMYNAYSAQQKAVVDQRSAQLGRQIYLEDVEPYFQYEDRLELVETGNDSDDTRLDALESAGGSSVADITILAADVATLDSVPVQLLPAPGAGLANVIDSVEFYLPFNTTPYSFSFVSLRYAGAGPGTNVAESDPFFLNAATTNRNYVLGHVIGSSKQLPENTAIELYTLASPAGGDSDLKLRITYRVITLLT